MKEVKISIRMDGDELPLIHEIKKLAIDRFGVKEDRFMYRKRIIGGRNGREKA